MPSFVLLNEFICKDIFLWFPGIVSIRVSLPLYQVLFCFLLSKESPVDNFFNFPFFLSFYYFWRWFQKIWPMFLSFPKRGKVQWLKKLSQCLAILKRLTCHKSNKIKSETNI